MDTAEKSLKESLKFYNDKDWKLFTEGKLKICLKCGVGGDGIPDDAACPGCDNEYVTYKQLAKAYLWNRVKTNKGSVH